MIRIIEFTLFVILALFFIFSGTALAQEGETRVVTDDEVNAIAKQLFCPVCENVPLDACPALSCIQWREMIRELIAQGWSEAEIIDYLVEEYGDEIVPLPPPRGFNWMLYIIPPVAILAGSFMFFKSLKSSKKDKQSPVEDQQPPEPSTDKYVARLEDELRKR